MSQTASSVAEPAGKIEELRTALNQLLAADRRLRGRDHSRPGALTFAQIRTIAALGLDQLEAANIVERRRSTEDRRVCNVALTPEGRELLERKLAVWHGLWAERLAGFNDKEIETAAAILHEVTGILDTVASSLDPG